ncbi:MAG: hypothetical protein IJ640_00180 [Prevotella sp.]|nr:hypothetical protein [Prevotella sp.]
MATTRPDTQRNIIRQYLLDGNTITPMEALHMCGCFRLSAVIFLLRHDEGLPILMDQPQASDGKPYARYWIDKAYFNRQTEISFEKGTGQ